MSATAVETVLKCEGLHKTYRQGDYAVPVLLGIDLAIRRGETLAIVGASGSGKSTLLHLLGGLDAPSAGRVSLLDEDVFLLSERRRSELRNRRRRHADLFSGPEREHFFDGRVVPDAQYARGRLRKYLHHLRPDLWRRMVQLRQHDKFRLASTRLGDQFGRLPCAFRRRRHDDVGRQPLLGQPLPHARCIALAALVQRPVMVGRFRVFPA